MAKLKDFLYLDTSLVNSIFSQYYEGVITSMTKANSKKEDLKASIGFDLKLVKGSTGGTDGSEQSESETIDLHHYAYEVLEAELIKSGVINGVSQDIVKREGNLRIVDSLKATEAFSGLKALISGFDAAMKLANNSGQANVIPQDVRTAAQKSNDISKLVGQLYNNGIFAYIDGEKIVLDRQYLVSKGSPEFINNGKMFEGNYVIVGLNSKLSTVDTVDNSEDILLTLSHAFSGIQDIAKLSTIKPIAIYRVINTEE